MNPIPKPVEAIYAAGYTSYEGLDTWRVMPTRNVPIDALEPFLFLNHHGPQVFAPGNNGLPFGPHPHKGFETVTFIVDGELVHEDSTGFRSNIKAGGVQWMTAGRGIIHAETSSADFLREGGNLELLQLWVNLPARLKHTPPAYIGLQQADLPQALIAGNNGTVTPVSGTWEGMSGPIDPLSDVRLALVSLPAGGQWTFTAEPGRSLLYYIINGQVRVNGETAVAHDLVTFGATGSAVHTSAEAKTLLLIGDAQPNREPIAAHGPFVMNTQEEIREAFVAYQKGAFGVWPH